MKKKILFVFSVLLLVLSVFNRKIIFYGFEQLRGQLHIDFNAKEIGEVINDFTVADSIKQKLLLIQEIKKFAVDSIGLKPTKNYSTYYDQKGKPVLWVLTASSPFEMKSYEWDYPFLGSLSYKGFFEKEKGEKEKAALDALGFDTDLSTVGGWSTLGWFRDPVLSNMLRKVEGSLAELVIHELTHATIYIADNVEYNENLATFVGEKGAEKFLSYKFKNDSAKIIAYLHRRTDEEIFGNYIVNSIDTLSKLFKSLEMQNISAKEKYLLKYRKIVTILSEIKNLPLQQKQKYLWDFSKEPLPNNTYFLSYSNYRKKQNVFEKFFVDSCDSDLKIFVEKEKNNF